MNWEQIRNNWNEVSDTIKCTWGKLTEDDLTAIAGQRDQLAGLLQERYGWKKPETDDKVDQFARGLRR